MRGRIIEKDLYHFQVEHLKYEDLYQSIEELKQWEIDNNTHCINWNKWDEVIEETKQDITKELEQKPTRKKRKAVPTEGKKTYVYNAQTLQLLGKFDAQHQAAIAMGMSPRQVGYIIWKYNGLYQKKNLLFTNKKLPIN